MADNQEAPFFYNVFKLAFTEPGAITYFSNYLPTDVVGFNEGQTGIGELYVALLDFYDMTHLDPVDPLAFQSWLQEETEIHGALGGAVGVKMLFDMIMTLEAPGFEAVTKVLKHRANKRKQLESLQELQMLVSKKEHKSEIDRDKIHSLTENIRALEKEIGYDPLEHVHTADKMSERADGLWELPDFLPTQFLSLNKAMGYTEEGGFCKGAVHAILAASGRGKSSFAKSLMNHWVENGYSVLYVNYEEAIAHWERVLFTQVTGQNVYKANQLTKKERASLTKQFQETMKRWGDNFMVHHDPETPYFDDLERWLRDIAGHNNKAPDVIIVDTIQSLFLKGGGAKPRWGQYEEMMVRFEKLAKDLNSAVIITAQENSNRMKERREVVEQSDIGGSLSIAQKSSITIFITEKKLLSHDDAEDERIMQLQIPKNRITGTTFTLEPLLVKYDDETKSYLPYEMVENIYNPGIGLALESLYEDGDAI